MSLGTPWMFLSLPLIALVGWLMARARRLQRDAALGPERRGHVRLRSSDDLHP